MKRIKLGFLALAALAGATSAFTTTGMGSSKFDNKHYHVTGETGDGLSYTVVLFGADKVCSGTPSTTTCGGYYDSPNEETQILKAALTSVSVGTYIDN
jgi:hypothetical protein